MYQPRSIICDLSPKYFIHNEEKLYFLLVITPSCLQCVFRSYHYNADLSYNTRKINKAIEKMTNGRCVRRTLKNQNCLNENFNSRLNSVSPNIRYANLCFSFCYLQKWKILNTCKTAASLFFIHECENWYLGYVSTYISGCSRKERYKCLWVVERD